MASSSKTLRSITLKEPLVVNPQMSIFEATKLMAAKNIDSVIVVGLTGNPDTPPSLRKPQIHGIVTVKDVSSRVIAKGLDPARVTVAQVMTSPIQSVSIDTTLYKVVMMMNQNNFRQVPVVEGDKVVGLVTATMLNTSIINDIVDDIRLLTTIFR
ncbi:MAG: CBS domain-containing protein [Candidatus Altiarchaeota archaeon]